MYILILTYLTLAPPPLTHKSTYFFKKCLFMRSTKIINDKLIRLADINYAPGCEFLAIFLHQYACVSVKCIVSMSLMLIIFKCYKNRLSVHVPQCHGRDERDRERDREKEREREITFYNHYTSYLDIYM